MAWRRSPRGWLRCAGVENPIPSHWFQPLAEFLGPAYLRNAFTKGTEQEVGFLWEALRLEPGMNVLDVGCGPGRHALALGRRGVQVTGVDISEKFVALARKSAEEEHLPCTFEVGDARAMNHEAAFDAVICLCQGAFGLPEHEGDDRRVFDGLVRAMKPGGRLALSAFSAYFAVRFLEEGETFDAERGVHHEVATLRNAEGQEQAFAAHTSCWTPRELRLLATVAGLTDVAVHGVAPGRYGTGPPDLECPEFLLLAFLAAGPPEAQ